jgi:hypothetical protein
MSMTLKITVFWNVMPCSLVYVTDISEECAPSIFWEKDSSFTLMMEAAYPSDMSASIYLTTNCHIPEDNILPRWIIKRQEQAILATPRSAKDTLYIRVNS